MFNLKSSNPTLQEKTFQGTVLEGVVTGQEMTMKGTMNRLLFLLLMMGGSTIFAWGQFDKGGNPMQWIWIGLIGGFILALVMGFKPTASPYLAPAFAIFEGLLVGSISAYYNYVYPGLPVQAVALTLLVTLVMFLIYRYRIIRVTQKFKTVIVAATAAIMLFYAIQLISFAISGAPLAKFTSAATPLGIGFSILVSGLAALNLLLNFDMIEKGIEMRARKHMEWYCAFALLVTIVWLYLELLRLLSKLQRN